MKLNLTFLKQATCLFLFFTAALQAQTIVVTSTANDGPGTLRQAVLDAGPGAQIILQVTAPLTLATEITINKSLAIDGAQQTISATGPNRIFSITAGSVVGISNITFTNGAVTGNGGAIYNAGSLTLANCNFTGNGAAQNGGAIYSTGTYVNAAGCTFTDNVATNGGGVCINGGAALMGNTTFVGNAALTNGGAFAVLSGGSVIFANASMDNNVAQYGGGLYIFTAAQEVTYAAGNIIDNTASVSGGGIYVGTATVQLSNCNFTQNVAQGAEGTRGGGGIYNNQGIITVNTVVFDHNIASGAQGSGGALYNELGSITISNTDFTDNNANLGGGAIQTVSGVLTVNSSNFLDNDARPGNGGAISAGTGTTQVTLNESTFTGNVGANGGALYVQNGNSVTVNATTFLANHAIDGGAAYNAGGVIVFNYSVLAGNTASSDIPEAPGKGGGLFNNSGTTAVILSTISGNTASSSGGGVYAPGGVFIIMACTVTLNAAVLNGGGIADFGTTNFTVKNSIIAGNSAPAGKDTHAGAGSFTSTGYNLIGIDDNNSWPAAATDIEGTLASPVNPGLHALADNGGPTKTHALICPSPAADLGDPADIFTDQRGEAIFNNRRDIGAFEAQQACTLSATQQQMAAVVVYPNPSRSGLFSIRLPFAPAQGTTGIVYEIATGKKLLEIKSNETQMHINLSQFAQGTYILQVITNNAVENFKIVYMR